MKEEPKHGLEVNKTRTRVLKGKRWGGGGMGMGEREGNECESECVSVSE